MSGPGPNPFVGARAFTHADAMMFHGRAREARELTALLTSRRVVLLHAPAGAGKTSLVQAALVPALEAKEFRVLPVVRVNRPADGPPGVNRYARSAILSLNGTPGEAAKTLPQFLDALPPGPPTGDGGPRPDVLVLDQFEEVLTLDGRDTAAKAEFFGQLDAVIDPPASGRARWVLFSFREEYLGAVLAYLRGLSAGTAARYRLDLLSVPGAAAAIREPAFRAGVAFADGTRADKKDGAAERLADNLSKARPTPGPGDSRVPSPSRTPQAPDAPPSGYEGFVEPVQLQVVCFRLWERLREVWNETPPATAADGRPVVTAKDVDDLARVDDALAAYYRDGVAKAVAAGADEWAVRDWFENTLLTPAGRVPVADGPGGAGGLPKSAVDVLVGAYLVRREERKSGGLVELAHDRLIDPIRADNAAWTKARLQPFQLRADEWSKREPGPAKDALLLRDVTLATAEQWRDAHPGRARPVDDDLLRASRAVRTTRERVRTLAYQWWAYLSTAGLVIGLGLAVVARLQYVWADEERAKAADAARRATASADAAEAARVKADAERAAAFDARAKAVEAWEVAGAERAKAEWAAEAVLDQYVRMLTPITARAGVFATAATRAEALDAAEAWTQLTVPADNLNAGRSAIQFLWYQYELQQYLDGLRKNQDVDRKAQERLTLNLARKYGAAILPADPELARQVVLRLRERTYPKAVKVTAEIAALGKYDANQDRRFWELYYGELAVIEGADVAGAMVAFGGKLTGRVRDPKALTPLAERVAAACAVERKPEPYSPPLATAQ